MNCPDCGKGDSSVLETRPYPGSHVTRRRQCGFCGGRWASDEKVRRGSFIARGSPQPVASYLEDKTQPVAGNSGNKTQPVESSIGGVGGAIRSEVRSLFPDSESGPLRGNPGELQDNAPKRRRRAPTYSADFLAFWKVYPRKVKKPAAAYAWQSEQPDLATVIEALAWQTRLEEWTKEGGTYVPHPASYINGRRWEDEPPASRPVAPAPAPKPAFCPWHADWRNSRKPSRYPKPETCSECKHLAAASSSREGDPTLLGDLLGGTR